MGNRYAWTVASLFVAQVLTGASEAADAVLRNAAPELVPQVSEAPPSDFSDVRLAAAANASEETRSTAISPKNSARIAVAVTVDGRCIIRRSGNGGASFAASVTLPLPAGDYYRCTGAVVAYAPDGLHLYAAYQAYRHFAGWSLSDVVVSTSADNGVSWTDPKVVLAGSGDDYEYDDFSRAQLATPLAAADARYVYLAAVKIGYHYYSSIFSRSTDGGQTWTKARGLANGWYEGPFVGSPKLAGGPGGRVVAAWAYDDVGPAGIRVATSLDYGATFTPAVSAVTPSYPEYAGQPSVKIGTGGTAQLVYAAGDYGVENEQIRYTYSAKAPYQVWAAPMTLNDDGPGNVHAAPLLAIEPCGNASILHVAWWDGRDSGTEDHLYYTRRLAAAGGNWSPNISISTVPSLRRHYDIYDSVATFGGLAAGGGKAFLAWSSLKAIAGTNSSQSDVFGSRINSGIDCR